MSSDERGVREGKVYRDTAIEPGRSGRRVRFSDPQRSLFIGRFVNDKSCFLFAKNPVPQPSRPSARCTRRFDVRRTATDCYYLIRIIVDV